MIGGGVRWNNKNNWLINGGHALLWGWFRGWENSSESCVLIGDSKGQDGPILAAWDFPQWSRKKKKLPWSYYNNYLNPLYIDPAYLAKMARYWQRFFLHSSNYWPTWLIFSIYASFKASEKRHTFFLPFLTLTLFRPIKTRKNIVDDIQLLWPHTW